MEPFGTLGHWVKVPGRFSFMAIHACTRTHSRFLLTAQLRPLADTRGLGAIRHILFPHFLLLSALFRHRILSGPRSTFAAVCPRLWFLPASEDAAGQCARLSPAVRRAAPRGGRLLRNSEGKPIWIRASASKRLVPASHLGKVSREFSARARSAVTRWKTRFQTADPDLRYA